MTPAAPADPALAGAPARTPPVLSVIVPALRADLELRRCIDSIRLALPDAQACEIVLVLPGAQHAAGEAEFPGVRVVAETRPSVYGAMNDGIAASHGRFLYFLGKDDILLPGVREVMALLADASLRAVFTDVYWGSEGRRRCRPSKWRVLFHNVCQQGIVYSREALVANGPFLRRLRVQADHLMNVKVLWDPQSRGRVRYLPVPLAWYAATGLSYRARDTVFHRVHATIVGRYLGPVAGGLWRCYKRIRPDRAHPL